MAAAEEKGANAAMVAVLSELVGIFTLKRQHKYSTEGYFRGTTAKLASPIGSLKLALIGPPECSGQKVQSPSFTSLFQILSWTSLPDSLVLVQ